MHRWGYAPTVEALATELMGGAVQPSQVLASIQISSTIGMRDGFVYLDGNQWLVSKSRARVASHNVLNGEALSIAVDFARELVSSCPVIDCVALSGSAASGGYARGDDIDFDLITRDGTKYIVYGVALCLGLKFVLRRWRAHGLRKLMCINVIWSRSETRPFKRQDEGLAFELLRCQPLFGSERYRDLIAANEWSFGYFPQLRLKRFVDSQPCEPNRIGRSILSATRFPRGLAIVNWISRIATRAVYEVSHLLRGRDPNAVARIKFLQSVKYPYEVFQD